MFGYLLIAVLALSFAAACGSGDDEDADVETDAGTTAVATTETGGATTATEAGDDATEAVDDMDATEATDADDGTAPAGDATGAVSSIGACFEENTTGEMVTDLREGNTESAEEVYRTCLEGALPAGLVAQLDPIIENAAECGSTAAQDLSDADVEAIESGDQATIENLTQDTLDCVSQELGIPLS